MYILSMPLVGLILISSWKSANIQMSILSMMVMSICLVVLLDTYKDLEITCERTYMFKTMGFMVMQAWGVSQKTINVGSWEFDWHHWSHNWCHLHITPVIFIINLCQLRPWYCNSLLSWVIKCLNAPFTRVMTRSWKQNFRIKLYFVATRCPIWESSSKMTF